MKYSGRTTALEHKFEDWGEKEVSNPSPAVSKVWYLDVQWSDCPVEVEDIVRDMWWESELSNDNCILKHSVDDDPDHKVLNDFLLSRGVVFGDDVIIHWWW